MKKINVLGKKIVLFFLLFSFFSCDKNDEIILLAGEQSDFIVVGASGQKIVLDRTWYRDCIASASMPNVWSSSQRTLSSNELATTEFLYGSSDCKSNLLMVDVTVVKLELQAKPTPISWVEMDGVTPSAAPSGLENVKEAKISH